MLLWLGVGIRLCLFAHGAFSDVMLFEVLRLYVGCEPLGLVPVFVVLECGLFVFRCVHRWVAVGHDAGGREGHVDARWRLRHRALSNGCMGLCV